jgi:iron complex outermembrane receptor protein
MAKHSPLFARTKTRAPKPSALQTAVALCLLASAQTWAQQVPTEITITDKLPNRVSGFGDVSAQELPMSTSTFTSTQLREIGAQRVSDALRLDAAVSDSYNSPAYWDMLSVRGFTLDNRYNYRREGLPISAETMIPLDNKERIELLKGTSGIQAGTSAPGGLVNYVVKRAPTQADQPISNITLGYGSTDSRLMAADLGGRFGEQAEWGYRFNAAHEDLKPYVQNATGSRDLMSLALDWRLKPGTVLDVEFENSRREQVGVNGYSLLAGQLPHVVDPSRNLTYQPWTMPGVFNAMTGSVRLRQALNNGWQWTTQYGAQRLKTDDRLTFGYGCTSSGDYTQYCANGELELSDYRSENERRLTDALQTEVSGSVHLANVKHNLSLGFLRQRQLDRLPSQQAWNYAGWTTLSGGGSSSADGHMSNFNSNRSEYANEFSIKDRIELSPATSLWAGLRHISFNRSSEKNDPTAPNTKHYTGDINVPWLGTSTQMNGWVLYASHGHGIEQFVAPNSATYANAGEQLGVKRTRQTETGVRSPATQALQWNATVFQIERPLAYDQYVAANYPQTTTKFLDGVQTHRGLETGLTWRNTQWQLGTQAQWLHARISDVQQTTNVVGDKPLNVPAFTLRGMAEYRFSSLPGLRSGLSVSHEGKREVLENGTLQLPSWTTWGALAHYDTKVNNMASTWTLAVDNLTDKRYWRESPKQFGHYYLYPGAPQTIRASVQFRL